jgi:very-short-patch-repair endonuclease
MDGEDIIARILVLDGYKFEREYKFCPDRKFRADFAIPGLKVLIEYEGAVYTQGRHTRGAGYVKDCEKYNIAAMLGWHVLRYTANDLRNNRQFLILQDLKNFGTEAKDITHRKTISKRNKRLPNPKTSKRTR